MAHWVGDPRVAGGAVLVGDTYAGKAAPVAPAGTRWIPATGVGVWELVAEGENVNAGGVNLGPRPLMEGDTVPLGVNASLPEVAGMYWVPDYKERVWRLTPDLQSEKSRVAAKLVREVEADMRAAGAAVDSAGREPGEIERVLQQLALEQRLVGEAVLALEVALARVLVPLLDMEAAGRAPLPGVDGAPPVTLLGQLIGDRVVGLQALAADVRDLTARVAL